MSRHIPARDAGLMLAALAVGVTAMLIPWSWDVQAAQEATALASPLGGGGTAAGRDGRGPEAAGGDPGEPLQSALRAASSPEGGAFDPAGEAEAYEVLPWGIELEDPEEDAKIEAALVAQGYFRPEVPLSYDLQDELHTACTVNGVPYELALGLIQEESGFDPDAVNGDCYGLCQLNTKYHPADLSPVENIRAGMAYLGEQLGRYDTVEAALEGYHAGHNTGDRTYARVVMDYARDWGWTG